MPTTRGDVTSETVLAPDLPIIDAHHHVRDRVGDRYMFDDLRVDLSSGHRVVATVAVECEDMYRAAGPIALRPVGETEFLVGIAAMFSSGRYGGTAACSAIVGYVDLRLGAEVLGPLEAQKRAAGGRLRGIRNIAAWHPDKMLQSKRAVVPRLLEDAAFRRGASVLADWQLPLDVWVFHTQLAEVVGLASACPELTIVLDHLGGPLGAGPFRGARHEVFEQWRVALREVARCPNVVCKLGGLGQPVIGLTADGERSTSQELAPLWRPYVETGIELFGADRCMFESNFPPDRAAATYTVLWNTFKRITSGATESELHALYRGTAARVYQLPLHLAASHA